MDTFLTEEVVLYSLLFPHLVSCRGIRQPCIPAFTAPSRRAPVLFPPTAQFRVLAERRLNFFVLRRITQVLFKSLLQACICPFRRGPCDAMGFLNHLNRCLIEGVLLLVTFDRGARNALYRFLDTGAHLI